MKQEKPDNRSLTTKSPALVAEPELFILLNQWLKKIGYLSCLVAVPALATSEPGQIKIGGSGGAYSVGEGILAGRVPSKTFASTAALDERNGCPGQTIPGGNYTIAHPFTVSGDTTGAGNKVVGVCGPYCYSYIDTPGSDHIYSFKASTIQSGAVIEVVSNSAGYSPVVFFLDTSWGGKCPTGADNFVWQPNWSATGVSQLWSDLANRQIYVFVDSLSSGANGAGSYTLRMKGVTVLPSLSVAGHVMSPTNRGLRNAVVSITNSAGVRRTVLSSSLGYYTFTNLAAGQTYTVAVNSKRYRFESRTVSPGGNLTDIDFVGFE